MAKARKPSAKKRPVSAAAAKSVKTAAADQNSNAPEDGPTDVVQEQNNDNTTQVNDISDDGPKPIEEDALSASEAKTADTDQDTDPLDQSTSSHSTALVATPAPARSGFWPLVLGGAVAAALGFVAGRGDLLDSVLPGAAQNEPVDLSEINGAVDQVASQVADQNIRLTALENSGGATPSQDFGAAIETLETTIAELQSRLSDVEQRPAAPTDGSASSAELTALQNEIAAQKAEVDALLATAQSAEDEARAAAQQTLARAALARVMAALDSGKPFAAALADLTENSTVDVPENLAALASSGVATLADLQGLFPPASRAALAASRATAAAEQGGGVLEFLDRQLGARSVTPREGTDPDAVLSRAEAAVGEGRLTDALAEIATLPVDGQAAMSDWLANATAYQNAQNAAETLAQSLTAN
ncbi:MAG: hypothetical protein WBC93_09970 [Sulfitobacter sp.]